MTYASPTPTFGRSPSTRIPGDTRAQSIGTNIPYSLRGHDGQKERLVLQIYRKFARQYVNCDVTSLLLHVPVT